MNPFERKDSFKKNVQRNDSLLYAARKAFQKEELPNKSELTRMMPKAIT